MEHLDQKLLAKRWMVSERTLEQWRWQGRGPRYLKIGGRRVIYPLAEIERYEASNLCESTVGPIDGETKRFATPSVETAATDRVALARADPREAKSANRHKDRKVSQLRLLQRGNRPAEQSVVDDAIRSTNQKGARDP